MQLEGAQEGKMWLGILLALTLCPGLEGQENSFTINHIHMNILPGQKVQNGQNLTLQCIVDISTTSQVKPLHWVLFYKDDVLFHNVSSTKNKESYFIPQVRVSHAGIYKCTVILNKKEKTTIAYRVSVKGVSNPRVTVNKREAIEGGVITVNCSVPEENPPIHFTVEKLKLDEKDFKETREKVSQNQNFMVVEFTVEEEDHVIFFQCQARIFSGTNVEMSEATKSDMVTVTESFSHPRFYISPVGVITEGDQLNIKCTIQVTHLVQSSPEIIIQKDKAIVAHKMHGNEAIYSVMAMVEHSGNYTCKVEASRISKVNSIVVNITELFSKPKLESSTTRLDHGERLNLWCSIPGAPPASFTIQKESTVVSLSQNFTKIASEKDRGTYTCTAGIGKVVKKSNAVQITVCEMLSKPRIFYDSSSEVIKGQTIAVSCQSVNGTTPITYHLLKAGSILESCNMNSNEPAVFKDKPTKDVEYQCMADNCHSYTEIASEVLRVNVVAPVDEVKLTILLTEEVESGKELVLRCSVNNASGPITYRFYREKEGSPFYQTVSNDTKAIWHKEKASKEHEGQYYCTAFNRANSVKSNSQSNVLNVRVFLAPWKKGLIAVVVIGVIIVTVILGARCCFLKKAKAKQTPMEMARPAVPLLNSSNDKMSDANTEANKHYGYSKDVRNHAMKPMNESKEPLTVDVEYTEVQVTSSESHQEKNRSQNKAPSGNIPDSRDKQPAGLGLESKGTETVYSEIRKTNPDVTEKR